MARSRRRRVRRVRPDGKRKGLREQFLRVVGIWNRFQVGGVIVGVVLIWLTGAAVLYLVERETNKAFGTVGESLWNVWVLIFSGDVEPPTSIIGRITSMILLVAGVGVAGLFTASVASLLVERYLRRSDVSHFEMDDHLVLCNWAPRALEWIREVHSKIITDPRPIVIIHDNPDEIDLPDKQDEPAFNDVYIVKGDPTNEVILQRAKIAHAHSIVILSDSREGRHADGKSILTCIAIRQICRGEHQPNIIAECHNSNNRFHLLKAGASEIVSSDSLGIRLLARSALFHGMTQFYQELLTVRRDANEVYLLPAPEALVGRDFGELSEMFMKHRNDRRSCLLIGIQRGEEMLINPIGEEAGPLQASDQLILLSRVFPGDALPLPTKPPVAPAPQEKIHIDGDDRECFMPLISPVSSPVMDAETPNSLPLPRVVADLPLDATIQDLLRDRVELIPWQSVLERHQTRADAIYTYGHPQVGAAMLDRIDGLKVISNYGVGVDHINLAEAEARGVAVGNTPGVLEATTADMGFALLLASARCVVAGDQYARSSGFLRYDPGYMLGREVHGKTLGVIGLGQIGKQVARRALGFDMTVLYHNRRHAQAVEQGLDPLLVRYVTRDELLAQSDYVILCVPLTNETRGSIGAVELSLMKPSATLVNIARGAIVDTASLTEALLERRIAAAALDVTEPEPLPRDHPLLCMPNVLITPHLGSATVETRRRMAELSVENLLAGLRGDQLPHPVVRSSQ